METVNNNIVDNDARKAPSLPSARIFPKVMRLLLAITPRQLRIPMFFSICTALSCIATRVRMNYTFDGPSMHALLLKLIIEAEQSGGKSFCRTYVDNLLMDNLRKRDDEQRRMEQEYRELKQTLPKTQKLPDPPKTTIRSCQPATSIAMMIKRADAFQRVFGTPLTLWLFCEELSTITESHKRNFANLKSIERTSYDLGAKWGNDYLSEQAYSSSVDLLQCSIYLGTPNAVDTYADKAYIEGGGVTRTIFVKLDDDLAGEAPEFKQLTEEDKRTIDDFMKIMDEDVYAKDGTIMPEIYINMRWLDKTVRLWCEEQRQEILKSGSRAHDTFYKRSSVSAFRIATLCKYLYMKEGVKERDAQNKCKQIYLFAAHYILHSMLDKWGARFEELARVRTNGESKTRVPLYDQLTSPFSRDQLDELIKRNELSTPLKVFLSKWKAKGWIEQQSDKTFKKLIL